MKPLPIIATEFGPAYLTSEGRYRCYTGTTRNGKGRGYEYLARLMWKKYRGAIPRGYEIHHEDRCITNDDIANLRCVKAKS